MCKSLSPRRETQFFPADAERADHSCLSFRDTFLCKPTSLLIASRRHRLANRPSIHHERCEHVRWRKHATISGEPDVSNSAASVTISARIGGTRRTRKRGVDEAGVHGSSPSAGWVSSLGRRHISTRLLTKYTDLGVGKIIDNYRNVTSFRLTVRPNLNAYVERFVLSIKSECLERIDTSSVSNRCARAVASSSITITESATTKGSATRSSKRKKANGCPHGKVRCRKRLGGLLSYYHRAAA